VFVLRRFSWVLSMDVPSNLMSTRNREVPPLCCYGLYGRPTLSSLIATNHFPRGGSPTNLTMAVTSDHPPVAIPRKKTVESRRATERPYDQIDSTTSNAFAFFYHTVSYNSAPEYWDSSNNSRTKRGSSLFMTPFSLPFDFDQNSRSDSSYAEGCTINSTTGT